MKATDIIRAIVDSKGMKYSALAYQLHITGSVLYERLSQKNLSVNKLYEMLQALGYKIVVMPYNAQVKSDWYEITSTKE